MPKHRSPIGVIDCSWSGTPIEPWIPACGYESEPLLEPIAAKAKKEKLDFKSPSAIYNGMVSPFVKFPIKGAIWYQGESNGANDEAEYHAKMRALVSGWRKERGLGDFPFYLVQLASFDGKWPRFPFQPGDSPEGDETWARVRMAQLKSLQIPNTGMAVAFDMDVDLHPRNKFDIGERLALWSLAKDYGKRDIVFSGPLYKSCKKEGSRMRVAFDHVGSGLMIGKKSGRRPAVEDKGAALKFFAIAGADKRWFWADAAIDGDSVLVSSPDVPEPVAVRYAFRLNPSGANLYNKDGLPASPFRTDEWKKEVKK